MKARMSSVLLLIVVFAAFLTMAFAPMPAPRLQEGGPVLSEVQLVYLGIIASGLLWVLKLMFAKGYKPSKAAIAIGLYVVSFAMAIFFTPISFPMFPPYSDAPTFVTALLTYGASLIAVASPIVGMAYLIYNWLLKRILDQLAARAATAIRGFLPATKTDDATKLMGALTEGRIVHYVLNDGKNKGQHRPAIVVRVWRMLDGTPPENGCCQLLVFTDSEDDALSTVLRKTSVTFDASGAPGSWHWIARA